MCVCEREREISTLAGTKPPRSATNLLVGKITKSPFTFLKSNNALHLLTLKRWATKFIPLNISFSDPRTLSFIVLIFVEAGFFIVLFFFCAGSCD